MILDVELLVRAQQGDSSAVAEVVARFDDKARTIAAPFFMADGDRDDVLQEAMVGILRGIRTFRADRLRGGNVDAYLAMCVRRWLIWSCVKRPGRLKNRPLNEAIRVASLAEDEAAVSVDQWLPDRRADVVRRVEARAELAALLEVVERDCPPSEARAVIGLACGLSYAELADQRGISRKTIDGALFRARQRLRTAA